MNEFYDEVNDLVNDIITYKISKQGVQQKIYELKKKYGNNVFPEFTFKVAPKPWNKDYLIKLKEMNITGACSEEFLLHMAEVGETIAKKKKKVYICLIGCIIVAVILLIALFGKIEKANACVITECVEESQYLVKGEIIAEIK